MTFLLASNLFPAALFQHPPPNPIQSLRPIMVSDQKGQHSRRLTMGEPWVERPLVQILVVVANTSMRT